MRKPIYFLMSAVIVVTLLWVSARTAKADDDDSSPRSIAILPFEKNAIKLKGMFASDRQQTSDLTDAVMQRITSAFFNTKRFNILERSVIIKVFEEMKLQGTAEFSDASTVKLGKILGANIIAIVAYTANMEKKDESSKCKSSMEVDIKLIDVQSTKIRNIIRITSRGSAALPEDSVNELLGNFSKILDREAANHYPQAGFIIKVLSPSEAVIDIGRKAGITEDDEFIIFKVSEEIEHPVTKRKIPGERIPLGDFSIVSISKETSIVKSSNIIEPLSVGSSVERKPRKPGLWENISNIW